jgi:hypothetical protein
MREQFFANLIWFQVPGTVDEFSRLNDSQPIADSGKVRPMFQQLKTFLLIASVLTIPAILGGCKSRQTQTVSPAPPVTAQKDDGFYKMGRASMSRRPKLLPVGPSREIENPAYDNNETYGTSTVGPNLPLPAPPTEE